MRILIVGGEGFIGHFLQAALRKTSHQVTVWDVKCAPESGAFVDITDLQTFGDDASFDIVINLAAEHRDDVSPLSRYYEVNVKGTQNLCDWCEQKGIKRIIHASSVAVHGYAVPDSDEGPSTIISMNTGAPSLWRRLYVESGPMPVVRIAG